MEQLVGAEIVWWDDWYDGPLDGLVRHHQRDLWFCVDQARDWNEERPRTYLAYELSEAELAQVHEVRRADAERGPGARDRRALSAAWGDECGWAPPGREPVGWFQT